MKVIDKRAAHTEDTRNERDLAYLISQVESKELAARAAMGLAITVVKEILDDERMAMRYKESARKAVTEELCNRIIKALKAI